MSISQNSATRVPHVKMQLDKTPKNLPLGHISAQLDLKQQFNITINLLPGNIRQTWDSGTQRSDTPQWPQLP